MVADIPNLKHLRTFVAVARIGSINKAASQIHMSQPAATQALAKLDAVIGTPLFDRRSSGSYATAAGRILLRRVERFFDLADDALKAGEPDPSDQGSRLPALNLVTSTHIRSLVAIAVPGMAPESARAMRVCETTLYRTARELGQIMGCVLVRHSAHGPVLTPRGAEVARQLGVAVRELDHAREEIAAATGQAAPVLSIGVRPMSGSSALAAAIDALARRHPTCSFKLVEGTQLALLNSLRAGEVDLNFGLIKRPYAADDVTEMVLYDDAFCVVARRGHPLTRAARPTRGDLARYQWVVPPKGTPRRRVVDDYFAGASAPMAVGIETSSPSMVKALLANSDRISVMSRREADADEVRRIFAVLPVEIGESSPKGITMRANWLPTAIHAEFIELLKFHTAVHPTHGIDREHNRPAARPAMELASRPLAATRRRPPSIADPASRHHRAAEPTQ